jgi:predicted signal transduction protein with EAL and GGDEF domain
VQHATTGLMEAEARADAQTWASYLRRNLPDLPRITAGGAPSSETLAFLSQARDVGGVFSFRVYNNEGLLQLRSEDFGRRLSRNQPISLVDPDFATTIIEGQAATRVREGHAIGEPKHYATTMLPIYDDKQRVGWLITNIDQTERHALFFAMASQVSIAVGSLLALAPLLGFWYRTRQKRQAERQLQDFSRRDALTGLDNRQTFMAEVEKRLAGPAETASKTALIVIEITDLSTIDQDFGLQAAECQIIATALRLTHLTPEDGKLGRIDTARFGLLLGRVADPMDVLTLTKELTVKLSEAVDWNGQTLSSQAHAGIGLSKSDGGEAATLLRSAEMALRSAQEQGAPGYGFFNPAIAQDARRRLAVQRAVAEATANNAFRLDFQPVYNIRNGELAGFEALIRLHDSELGAISPGEFIPIAEQTGLINRIGTWCLQEACRVAADWPAHLVVAVNLSPSQFYSGSLLNDVQQALINNRFPSYRLEVEITEGTLLKDSELVMEQLRALRELGVAVALDDFGTGYSSLSYLWKFPFSKLKIDRSFVMALDETQSARGILRSIVKLGHGLGLTVTAEGIENNKQFTTLRDLGCDLAQGYLLDRPSRVEDLAAIILRNFAKGLQRRPREAGAGSTAPEDFKTVANG